MGDIQAFFHQVRVAERTGISFVFVVAERRFYKRSVSVCMTVHLFGAVSSPSCAAFALRKTADDHKCEFREEMVQTLKDNFYVDCLKSVASEEAGSLVQDLSNLCQQGGLL